MALALAGCGALPRPFASDVSEPNPADTLQPVDAAGIVVTLVGVRADDAAPFAPAVARALREREVPATTREGNEGSLALVATVTGAADGLAAAWALTGPGGAVGGFEQALTADDLDDRQRLSLRAAETADAVVGLLADAARGDRADDPPVFAVLRVLDAPGDGPESLTNAMKMALASTGARLADEPGPGVFAVSGRVSVAGEIGGSQRVSVLWEVHDEAGKRLGTVRQQNSVPRGRIDGRWGALSAAIAAGGAQGVRDLVERAAGAP